MARFDKWLRRVCLESMRYDAEGVEKGQKEGCLKRCRICGAENGDDAIVCSGCSIRFASSKSSSFQSTRTRNVGGLFLQMFGLVSLVAMTIMFVGRREFERCGRTERRQFASVERDNGHAGEPKPQDVPEADPPEVPGVRSKLNFPSNAISARNDDRAEEVVGIRRSPPYDLGREFVESSAWNVDVEGFLRSHPGIWYSKDGASGLSVESESVLFFGYPICEDTLRFGENGLESVEVSVFNKGIADAVIAEGDALEAVGVLTERLSGTRLETLKADDGRGKVFVRFSWEGSWPRVTAKMGYASEGGHGGVEYLNVRFEMNAGMPVARPSRNPAENVRRSGGDIYIEGIPMVNQGRKGYCVPASVGRVLEYYGIDTDMHELALLMDTDGRGGTKVGGKFPALNRVAEEAGMQRVDYKNLERYDEEYIGRYNRAARANRGRELKIEDFTVEEEEDGRIVQMRHYDWLVDAMDENLKRLSRDYDEEGFSAFKEGIVSNIREGRPLIWSVERLFPWDRPDGSSGGGHMRLVVGMNLSCGEILYSDSWGAGNEFKRVGFSDAWRETDFLSCIFPKPE